MLPCATASRAVVAFSLTSTIRTRPRASTCDSRRDSLMRLLTLGKVKRKTFERHRQIDALELHFRRHLECARGKVQDRLHARCNHQVNHGLSMRRRNGDDRDVEPFTPGDLLQFLDVVDGHATSRFVSDLLVGGVEQRGNLESFLAESRVIRQSQTEVAGAHDGDAQMPIETENLAEVAAQVFDVIADAANAKLAEIREILADLRRIEMKLLRQRL